MGIKSLHDVLESIDHRIFLPCQKATYPHVLIDGNAQLHTAVRRLKGPMPGRCQEHGCQEHWSRVKKAVKQVFRTVLKHVTPTVSLTVLLDGVAPLAKLREQRRRRAGSKDCTGPILLTPGTSFMQRLSADLGSWLRELTPPDVSVRVSGVEEPGEGELKICSRCAEFRDRDRVCCVSADHDMISIMMANRHMRRCDLVLQRSGTFESVRFPRIRRYFRDSRDLMIMCCLAGNDYLPRLGGTTIDRLFRAYLDLTRGFSFTLVNRSSKDARPHEPSLRRLFRRLARGTRPHVPSSRQQMQRYLDGVRWCCRQYSRGACEDPRFRAGPAAYPDELATFRFRFSSPNRTPQLSTTEAALIVFPAACCPVLLPNIRRWTEPASPLHRWFQIRTCAKCDQLKQQLSAAGKRHHRNPTKATLEKLRAANRASSRHQAEQHAKDRINFDELVSSVTATLGGGESRTLGAGRREDD